MQDGIGDMERIGMINQRRNPLEPPLLEVWREYGTVAYINIAVEIIHTEFYTSVECLIHQTGVCLIQSVIPTSYNTRHTQSTVNRVLSYIVFKYTCLSNIRIHYSKPLSDGSKKPNERTIGTSRTSYIPRCAHTEI
ncbi:hypothetical protein QLX08_009479 [Tetragonisca angustula]|uniref:Uncharacterized protein n=1 Tax=Tetragonisca angustula TaxID=166442 RepID=A0AAW0ZFX7_9HYME